MKKAYIAAAFSALLLLNAAGCGAAETENISRIAPMALTEEQAEIVDLLSTEKNSLYLFDLQTEEPYAEAVFWVEAYHYGEKVETQPIAVNLRYDQAKPLKGRLAAVVEQGEATAWSLIYLDEDGTKVCTNGTVELPKGASALSRASVALEAPCEITGEREAVLYACAFLQGTAADTFAAQDFLHADTLKEYEHVQILKCRCSSGG